MKALQMKQFCNALIIVSLLDYLTFIPVLSG